MPNRISFTQAAVEKLSSPATGRVMVWDKVLPGFGLRVAAPRPGSREGRKTWIAMYRVDGKSVMETIGTLAQIPKVDKARDLARASILKARGGAHPVNERRAEKTRLAAEKAAAEIADQEAVASRFDAVARRFLTEAKSQKKSEKAKPWSPKYASEFRRIIEHDVLPKWGERQIRSITKSDVNELLDAKAKARERTRKGTNGGAAIQANRTLTRLRTLFAWAVANELTDADPTLGVGLRGHEQARDRGLYGRDELLWFWRGTERAAWPFSAIFKLLLLTAQRESEVAGMRWPEIDIDKREWTIPRDRTKSQRAHVVALSEQAIEVIEALPRLGDLVFPTQTGRPISSFSKAKERLDAVMTTQLRKATENPEAEIEPWVIHDLRRTATTIMARLNIAPHVADKVLNHLSGTIHGVAATYNRFAYLEERKVALGALGHFIEAIVRRDAGEIAAEKQAKEWIVEQTAPKPGDSDKVIELHARAARA